MTTDAPRVAVTSGLFPAMPGMVTELRALYPDAKVIEGRPPTGADLVEFLRGYDVVVAGVDRYSAEIIEQLPDLKVISCCSAGLDHLDAAALNRRGIRVGWTAGVNKYAVSEMALCFMIDILRDIGGSNLRTKAGGWERVRGRLLRGRVVGVHGCGNIGREVVKLLQPFGVTILAHDKVDQPEFYEQYGVTPVSAEQLWAESEVLTVHLPRNRSTTGLYSAEVIDGLRQGIYVVNTSRGQIFDEKALAAALRDGRIAAAAFDVFATEPLDSLDLVQLPNFLATAHIGAGAEEAWEAMARAGIRGIAENFLPVPGDYPFD